MKCFIFVLFRQGDSGRLAPVGEDAQLYRSGDGLALVAYLQLAVNMVGVLLHRAWRDVQPGGDFADAEPFGKQLQHFKLTAGQQRLDLTLAFRGGVGSGWRRKCGDQGIDIRIQAGAIF